MLSSLTKRLPPALVRRFSTETLVLGVIGVLLGALSGAGVWLFKRLIDLFTLAARQGLGGALGQFGGWTLFLVPAVGGLVVGLLMYFFVGEERHHGVAGVMEAVALAGGRLRYQRAPVKVVAAALSIGSGASVGPEDPSVQIGANLGSMLGQVLHLSDDGVRSLVAAGAAAGIAAAFNAPIAGVFFALELILGELSGSSLSIVVLASVISAVVTQALSGPQPAFKVPGYEFKSAAELPLYLGLGLLAGPVAALYTRSLYAAQDVFHAWAAPRWLKPAAAGLIVGLVGLFLPQIMGVGYDTIGLILNAQPFALNMLVALVVGKLLMTAVSIGGGFPGGVFAPSIFLGAALGGAYGLLAGLLLPGMGLAPQAFAMVGMAAVLAGTVHAPLTAIILLFEMTNDYRIILPLMFAVLVSLAISQTLERYSVYGLGLARKGVRLERGRDVRVLEGITVGEVMQPDTTSLRETDSLKTAADTLLQSHHHGLPVVDQAGNLVGIITLQDLDRAHSQDGAAEKSVGEAATRDLEVAHPDETMDLALRRMSVRDLGRMPVVERDNPRHLLGMLRRSDIVRAYDLALTRRTITRHQAHQIRLGAYAGVSVEELHIEPGSACDGKPVKALSWPHESILVTLRRGRQVMIPHGDTVLKASDVLVVAAEGDALETLRQMCRAPVAEAG
jgi:CIC family chloride channel protein